MKSFSMGERVMHQTKGAGTVIKIDYETSGGYRHMITFDDVNFTNCWVHDDKLTKLKEAMNNEKRNLTLSLAEARKAYKETTDSAFKTLLLSSFTEEELTKAELPQSFLQIKEIEGYYINTHSAILPLSRRQTDVAHINVVTREKYTKAWLAFCQLTQLHKAWIGDWEHIQDNKHVVHVIERNVNYGKINIQKNYYWSSGERLFIFPTADLRDKFFDQFQTLLEEAKYFIH